MGVTEILLGGGLAGVIYSLNAWWRKKAPEPPFRPTNRLEELLEQCSRGGPDRAVAAIAEELKREFLNSKLLALKSPLSAGEPTTFAAEIDPALLNLGREPSSKGPGNMSRNTVVLSYSSQAAVDAARVANPVLSAMVKDLVLLNSSQIVQVARASRADVLLNCGLPVSWRIPSEAILAAQ